MAHFGSEKINKAMDDLSKIEARDVVRYAHMPEIMPRLRQLGTKLGHIAYMIALVYRSANLLPAGHPMLNPANIGRFGVRDVIATAANRLVLKRENTDQVLIFGAVMMALMLIVLQTILIVAYAYLGQAHAADVFTLPASRMQTDVVMQFLRQVFGVDNIFGTLGGADSAPQPGLHAVLGFYSTAMMIIAVLIVIYHVITVVGESAQTGTPFGRRFNGVWAPLRLVLALGLLVPLGSGLNAGQYLTLYVAKFGSALASNAWVKFTTEFSNPDALTSNVRAPAMTAIGNALFAAEVCRAAYNMTDEGISRPVVLRVDNGQSSKPATGASGTQSGIASSDVEFAQTGNKANKVTFIYAAMDPSSTKRAQPTCGSFEMELLATTSNSGNDKIKAGNDMARKLRNAYVQAVDGMLKDMKSPAEQLAKKAIVGDSWFSYSATTVESVAPSVASAINNAQTKMNTAIADIKWTGSNTDVQKHMKDDAQTRGWGTAGIYYLEMAKVTQLVLDAVSRGYPTPVMGPDGRQMMSLKSDTWFDWLGLSSADKDVRAAIALANETLGAASKDINVLPSASETSKIKAQSFGGQVSITRPLLWMANMLFGDAFITMVDKPELNPMGRLIEGGAFIMDRVELLTYLYIISNMGVVMATLVGAGAGLVSGAALTAGTAAPAFAMIGAVGAAAVSAFFSSLSGILWFFLTIGLGLGVVLFYVLPMMPFMYFFFSVVQWVVEVAEAFISMPLFALAHLRIDGEGMPGQTAYQGWLTLFGVMLRPILIVIGLIVGLLIFNGGSYFLNQVFKYAIFAYNPAASNAVGGMSFENISGFGLVVYIILYVYLVYMLATMSFKLIDKIPDRMLRWIGGGGGFTSDKTVDLGDASTMAIGGYVAMRQGGEVFSQRIESMNKKNQDRVGGMVARAGQNNAGTGPSTDSK